MDERGRRVYVKTQQAMALWQKRARMMDGSSSNSIEGGIGSDLSRMHVKRYQLFCSRLALSLLPPPPTSTSAWLRQTPA